MLMFTVCGQTQQGLLYNSKLEIMFVHLLSDLKGTRLQVDVAM